MDLGNSIVELDFIHIIFETRLEKLYYCRRDFAKHVMPIACMDPYVDAELALKGAIPSGKRKPTDTL